MLLHFSQHWCGDEDMEQRKCQDLEEAYHIFRLFFPIEGKEIEGMPVRLGRISNKPRMIRVHMRSDYLAKEITDRARNHSYILNPTETDKKKIYLKETIPPG